MLFLAMSILMFGCSTDDGGEKPKPKPAPTQEVLVANDDNEPVRKTKTVDQRNDLNKMMS